MNSNPSTCRTGAFTLVELLSVIAIIGILAALLLPALNRSKLRVQRIECENNLHQQGIAFQMFSHDHDGKFPMAVPAAEGGSLEFVEGGYAVDGDFYFAFRHFQTLSNDLGSPEVLVCPADTRLPATNFGALQNSNLSYFIGVKADFSQPGSILAGDRNLAAESAGNPSILSVDAATRLRWTQELHQFKGNILFADGHVEEWNNAMLASGAPAQLVQADLFPPTVPQPANHSFATTHSPPAGLNRATPAPAPTGTPAEAQGRAPMIAGAATRPLESYQATAGPDAATNLPAGANPLPAHRLSTNRPAGGTAETDEADSATMTFDQRVVKHLRRLIIGTYLLVLLLFLLRLAYLWWRRMQRKKEAAANGS